MQANYIYYNKATKLLVLMNKKGKPFYAASGDLIEKFYNNINPKNTCEKMLNIHTKDTLVYKIEKINKWLLSHNEQSPFYQLKTHQRNYYVNKLMELNDSHLTVIRA